MLPPIFAATAAFADAAFEATPPLMPSPLLSPPLPGVAAEAFSPFDYCSEALSITTTPPAAPALPSPPADVAAFRHHVV